MLSILVLLMLNVLKCGLLAGAILCVPVQKLPISQLFLFFNASFGKEVNFSIIC